VKWNNYGLGGAMSAKEGAARILHARNARYAEAVRQGETLNAGPWEFKTRIFQEYYDPVPKSTGYHIQDQVYELSVMAHGKMEYRIRDKMFEIDASRGDWIFIPAGLSHCRICVDAPAVILGYLFEVRGERNGKWSAARLNKAIELAGFHFPGNAELARIRKEMIDELEADRSFGAVRLSLIIKDFLLCFLRHALPDLDCGSFAVEGDADMTLRLIDSYIEENISRGIRLEDIAASCGLSVRHVNRLFTKARGVSLGRRITETRMKFARTEVEGGAKKIKQIALDLGYDNISYFNRVFKKAFGATPQALRQTMTVSALSAGRV